MMRTAWELSAGLLSFVVAIGIGYWFGGLLDARLGTSPWLMAIFIGFGFVAGVMNVYRTVSRAMRPPPAGPADNIANIENIENIENRDAHGRD
jgi:F0F1-type ATP synthase assembly protein I